MNNPNDKIIQEYLYVTFYTSSEAMATEKECKLHNVSGNLVPVPRKLSSGCGIAWKCEVGDKERVEKLLKERRIEYEQIALL